LEPSWRRLTVVAPGVLVAVELMSPRPSGGPNWVSAGASCGSLLRLASRLIELDCSSSAASTVTIGLVAVKSGRAMREPVTKIVFAVARRGGRGRLARDHRLRFLLRQRRRGPKRQCGDARPGGERRAQARASLS
jgi:hypothetical protein